MINRIAIFDLDETLCNTQHRMHHIISGDYDYCSYNNRMRLDTIYDDAKRLYLDVHENCNTAMYISTARPFAFWISTQKWLNENGIHISSDCLYMRDDYDDRTDSMVKEENLKKIRSLHPEGTPIIAFDDRDKIIRMYRSQGVTALQIRKGEY